MLPNVCTEFDIYKICVRQLNCHKSRSVHTSLEADTPKRGTFITRCDEVASSLRMPSFFITLLRSSSSFLVVSSF
jgi:hypothetical protein